MSYATELEVFGAKSKPPDPPLIFVNSPELDCISILFLVRGIGVTI